MWTKYLNFLHTSCCRDHLFVYTFIVVYHKGFVKHFLGGTKNNFHHEIHTEFRDLAPINRKAQHSRNLGEGHNILGTGFGFIAHDFIWSYPEGVKEDGNLTWE